MSYLYILLV